MTPSYQHNLEQQRLLEYETSVQDISKVGVKFAFCGDASKYEQPSKT